MSEAILMKKAAMLYRLVPSESCIFVNVFLLGKIMLQMRYKILSGPFHITGICAIGRILMFAWDFKPMLWQNGLSLKGLQSTEVQGGTN